MSVPFYPEDDARKGEAITPADHIAAALAAIRAIDVPEDAPAKLIDMLRFTESNLRVAAQSARLAEEFLDTLRELSSEDAARIIGEVNDEE